MPAVVSERTTSLQEMSQKELRAQQTSAFSGLHSAHTPLQQPGAGWREFSVTTQSHKSLPQRHQSWGLVCISKDWSTLMSRISSLDSHISDRRLSVWSFTFSCQHLALLPPTTISSAYLHAMLQMHAAPRSGKPHRGS